MNPTERFDDSADAYGANVVAIEPNVTMRARAEAVGLADGSVEGINTIVVRVQLP